MRIALKIEGGWVTMAVAGEVWSAPLSKAVNGVITFPHGVVDLEECRAWARPARR